MLSDGHNFSSLVAVLRVQTAKSGSVPPFVKKKGRQTKGISLVCRPLKLDGILFKITDHAIERWTTPSKTADRMVSVSLRGR